MVKVQTDIKKQYELDERYQHVINNYDDYRKAVSTLPGEPRQSYSAQAEVEEAWISKVLHVHGRELKQLQRKHEDKIKIKPEVALHNLKQIRQRKTQLLTGTGSLNLLPRLAAIQERFTRDYKDAYDRLIGRYF